MQFFAPMMTDVRIAAEQALKGVGIERIAEDICRLVDINAEEIKGKAGTIHVPGPGKS
jgi:hypothetical protein